eukprot:6676743-Alexandrium_andersonii.AAC.1
MTLPPTLIGCDPCPKSVPRCSLFAVGSESCDDFDLRCSRCKCCLAEDVVEDDGPSSPYIA